MHERLESGRRKAGTGANMPPVSASMSDRIITCKMELSSTGSQGY